MHVLAQWSFKEKPQCALRQLELKSFQVVHNQARSPVCEPDSRPVLQPLLLCHFCIAVCCHINDGFGHVVVILFCLPGLVSLAR